MRPSITIRTTNYYYILLCACYMNKWWPMPNYSTVLKHKQSRKNYIFNDHSFIAFVSFVWFSTAQLLLYRCIFNTWSLVIQTKSLSNNTTKTRLLLTSVCTINKYQWMRIQRTPKKSPSLQNHCALNILFRFNKLCCIHKLLKRRQKSDEPTKKKSFISFNFWNKLFSISLMP